jgi:glycerophosphoryl diester phosphodiesterase
MISPDTFRSVRRCFVAGLAFSLTVAVLPIAVSAAATRVEALQATLLHGSPERVLIAAHRADWRNYPENSLPAIEGSIALGVEMAEIDLQRTKDGELVLMHDATLDRTTTGQGKVADFTLAEIRTLQLRDGLGSPTRFGVPTLREALNVARGRILLNLDKGYRFLHEVLPILEETGTTRQVLLKGPGTVTEMRAEYRELLAKVAYMPVASFKKPGAAAFVRDWVREAKPCAIEMVYEEWTPEVAEAFALCRKNGIRIWVNTLWPQLAGGLSDDLALTDPDGVYGVLLQRGVSIFQTDRSRLLQDYLSRRSAEAGK